MGRHGGPVARKRIGKCVGEIVRKVVKLAKVVGISSLTVGLSVLWVVKDELESDPIEVMDTDVVSREPVEDLCELWDRRLIFVVSI